MRAVLILQSRLVCVLSCLHTMQNTVALSWCYFFAEVVNNHFTYKMKCTVNQWTKLKICVGGGKGGKGVALHGCDMYILHSHSHRHVDE